MNKLREIAPKNINPRYWVFEKVKLDNRLYKYIIWITKEIKEYKDEIGINHISSNNFENWLYDKYKDILELN